MPKILIIGVGGAGRLAVKRMKEVGVPNADFITIGTEDYDRYNGCKQVLPSSDIPHYNLVTMNGTEPWPLTNNPAVWANLAEKMKDQIGEIIEKHLK